MLSRAEMVIDWHNETPVRRGSTGGMNLDVQSIAPTKSGGGNVAEEGDTPVRHKTPLKARLLSPGLHLSPNDDVLEKAKARAARAVAQKRRSFGLEISRSRSGSPAGPDQEETNILGHDALKALLQNCLKLSAANKINQGNTWDLKLIDHLSELVKNDSGDEGRTNFQMASCTLETGVKIYSYRVDSVHTEAYKLLGGLSRTAIEKASLESLSGVHYADRDYEDPTPKPAHKKTGATLETSFEALNAKKLDVAFNVDPLFHQTSAQFDEGGARGLLLNNLSVYSGCEIVFDSNEIPEKSMKIEVATAGGKTATLDLSFMKESIEKMMDLLQNEIEITPTLKDIVKLLDDPYRTAAQSELRQPDFASGTPGLTTPYRPWLDSAPNGVTADNDTGEVYDHVDEGLDEDYSGDFKEGSPKSGIWSGSPVGLDHEDVDEGEAETEGDGHDGDIMSQDPLNWLTIECGILGKSNAWAGPGHWKYTKPRDNTQPSHAGDGVRQMNSKRKKKVPFSIDFEILPEIDSSAMEPPKNHRASLLPQSWSTSSTLLPEDCHYEASSLVKFFLRPSTLCLRRKSSKKSERGMNMEDFREMYSESRWDDDGNDEFGGWDDGEVHGYVDNPDELVSVPRKVPKIDVTHDKHSKQIDARVLKQMLWDGLQQSSPNILEDNDSEEEKTGRSFRKLLKHIPADCPGAALQDISVHLCFICLLHLANEQNLRLQDCPSMDDLRVYSVHESSQAAQVAPWHLVMQPK